MKITIEQLESFSHELSCEAVTEFSPGQTFTEKLKGMYAATTELVKERISSLIKEKNDPVDLSKLLQIAEQFTTSEMRDIQVMQVSRLGVSWLELASALDGLQAVTLNIDSNLIAPFTQYVGKAVNNPSLLNSFSFNPEGYKFIDVKEHRKKLDKMFNKPAEDYVKWSIAFPRQSDVKEFERLLQKIVLEDSKLSPITVEKALTHLNGTTRILLDDIDSPTSEYVLNKRSASYLSEMLLQIAQHVELYVIVHNYINDLLQCALKTQETLNINNK